MLVLVDNNTNEVVTPNSNNELIIQVSHPRGVQKGDSFKFGELVKPDPSNNNKGLVRSKKVGMSWNEYYPEVFNCRIEER